MKNDASDASNETDARPDAWEASMKAALAPFGWTCTDDFWRRYHTDPWVFNLANAVERQAAEIKRLHAAAGQQ